MENIKYTKKIQNIGRGKGGGENPLATRSPIRLQTPYDLPADPLLLLLWLMQLNLTKKNTRVF